MQKGKKLRLPFVAPRKSTKDVGGCVQTELPEIKDLLSTNGTVRFTACKTLGDLKSKDSVVALLALLQTEDNYQVKHQAVKALGAIADERALVILSSISSDIKTPYYIRNSALEAMKYCGYTPTTPLSDTLTNPNSEAVSLPGPVHATKSSHPTTSQDCSPSHVTTDNISHTKKRAAPKNTLDNYFSKSPKKIVADDLVDSTISSSPKKSTDTSPQSLQHQFGVAMSSYNSRSLPSSSFNKVIPHFGFASAVQTVNQTPPISTNLSLPSYSTRTFSIPEVASLGVIPTVALDVTTREPTIPLSDEQQDIVSLAISGRSFFFTGRAGTGKSLVMREMVQRLRTIHGEQCVFVTASTGIAACNIGGTTVHAFAGIGLGEGSQQELARKAWENKAAYKRWRSAAVLLIDEVSMLSGDFFDKIEFVARDIRENTNPFGNLQVILCGDFFQLPPVIKGRGNSISFCFDAICWNSVITKCVELKKVFRQRESDFVCILDEVRMGRISDKSTKLLEKCVLNSLNCTDGIQPTRLYPHKQTVDTENKKFLDLLSDEKYVFVADDSGNQNFVHSLDKHCTAPSTLELKVHAQVILIKNLDFEKEQVNGARGVVTGWQKPTEEEAKKFPKFKRFPIVRFSSGKSRVITPEQWSVEQGGVVLCSRTQIPLNLAWALSIHKSQGMTIDKLEVGLDTVFEWGQAYVALSRATSLEGLRILGHFDRSVVKTHPKVIQFHKQFANV